MLLVCTNSPTKRAHQATCTPEKAVLLRKSSHSTCAYMHLCASVCVRVCVCIVPLCSAILAHMLLNERLNIFGMLGCALCIVGSLTIVLHAPPERAISSVVEVWNLAMQPCE